MFTLGIPLKQKRRTLGYLSNEYFPGGMKKLGQQVPYEIISTDDGFFELGFPNMDEDEFRNITFQLKQQGVTVIGADSQLTEKTMKLANLIPLKEDLQVTTIDGKIAIIEDPEDIKTFYRGGTVFADDSDGLTIELSKENSLDIQSLSNPQHAYRNYQEDSKVNENRLSGPFNGEQIKKMVSRDQETMFFANGNYYQATSEFQDFKDDLSVMNRDGDEDYIDIKDIEFAEATHGFAGVGMENEGSCGYAPEGEDPNEADQPAGSHLLRKAIKSQIKEMMESFADDPDVPGTTGMEDAGGKVRDNILAAIPDNYGIKDLAQDIAYIIQNEYGSHNAKPFIQMVSQKLQKPNY